MVNKSTEPWLLERPRAFQTDPYWYEAYWYRRPAPLRPRFFNRSTRSVGAAFQKLPALLHEFLEIVRTGGVWPSRAIRKKQTQRLVRGREATDAGQRTVTAGPYPAKTRHLMVRR